MKPLLLAGCFFVAGYAIHEYSPHPAETVEPPTGDATQHQLEQTKQELNRTAKQLAQTQNQLRAMPQPTPAASTPAATPFPLARAAASTPPAWFQQRLDDGMASLMGPSASNGASTPRPPMGGGRRH